MKRLPQASLTLVVALGALLCFASSHAQTVYKIVGEDGKVTYTDKPPAQGSSEELKLPPVNTQPAIAPKQGAPSVQTAASPAAEAAPRYNVAIVSPASETHLTPGQWDLDISVTVEPALGAEHYLQLLDNGQRVGEPQKETAFTIPYIVRGSHALQARVVTRQGKVLNTSETVNVYVHRVNVKQ